MQQCHMAAISAANCADIFARGFAPYGGLMAHNSSRQQAGKKGCPFLFGLFNYFIDITNYYYFHSLYASYSSSDSSSSSHAFLKSIALVSSFH